MSIHDDLLVTQQNCSVTAFDMMVELSRDGRERGLWIFLRDHGRETQFFKWREKSLDDFLDYLEVPKDGMKRVEVKARFDMDFRTQLKSNVDEGALLEWPEVLKFYWALGEELEKRKPKKRRKGPPRAQDVRKWANDPPLYPTKARKKAK